MTVAAPRVLLLTRHYPPSITAGARRPYLLALGLRALGCEVAVVAPTLPPQALGVAAIHPMPAPSDGDGRGGKSGYFRDAVRAHLSLPDPDMRWSARAGRAALAWTKARGFQPDWVVSTSPPESVHIAAAVLASRLKARLACDLRDNWLDRPLLPQRNAAVRRAAEAVIARRVLRRADLTFGPTETILAEVRRHAPRTPAVLIEQPGPPPASAARRRGPPFTVLHTGSFSLSHGARGIEAFAELAHAYRTNPDYRFVERGRLTEAERSAARAAGIEVRPPAPLPAVWQEQADADVLVLVAAPGTDAVPGKLAEYRAAQRPILCLGGGAWTTALPGRELPPDEFLAAVAEARDPSRLVSSPPPGPEIVAGNLLRAMNEATS